MGVTPIRIAMSKAQSAELDAWAGRASYMRSSGTDKEFREHILASVKDIIRVTVKLHAVPRDPCVGCDMGPMCETYGPPVDGCDVVEASTVERYCKNCKHFKLYDGSCRLSTGEKDNNYTCKDFEECR